MVKLDKSYIDHIIEHLNESEVNFQRVFLYGSYLRNKNTANDVDIIVEYEGSDKEDHVFNRLNTDPIYLDGLKVDFNPINISHRGLMPYYGNMYGERVPLHYKEEYVQSLCEAFKIKYMDMDELDKEVGKYIKNGEGHIEEDIISRINYHSFVVCDGHNDCIVEEANSLEEALTWFYVRQNMVDVSNLSADQLEGRLSFMKMMDIEVV